MSVQPRKNSWGVMQSIVRGCEESSYQYFFSKIMPCSHGSSYLETVLFSNSPLFSTSLNGLLVLTIATPSRRERETVAALFLQSLATCAAIALLRAQHKAWGKSPHVLSSLQLSTCTSCSDRVMYLLRVTRIGNAGSSVALRLSYIKCCWRQDSTFVFRQLQTKERHCWRSRHRQATQPIRGYNALNKKAPSFWMVSSTPYTNPSQACKYNFPFARRLFSNTVTLLGDTVSHDTSESLASPARDRTCAAGDDDVGGNFELVYKGPLRSAVRAVKVFSLSTCAIALAGGPILVMLGNPTVPLIGRILMTSVVMMVGVSTTLILHWLMKGYVIEMYFDPKSEQLRVYTLTMLAGRQCHTFHLREAGPPESLTAFSTFQAQGKSYFMHTDVMENKALLGKILGPYMALENSELWKHDDNSQKATNSRDDNSKSS